MELIKLLLVATFLTLIPGQIIRIPQSLSVGAITVSDISVFLLDLVFLIYALAIRKTLKVPNKLFLPFALFSLWSVTTLIWALRIFPLAQVLISSLFLARFILYFLLSIVVFNIVSKDKIKSWINLILTVGVIYILIGFIQFVVVPDLTFLTPFGWDPHQQRIVATVIDPNFSGFIFTYIFTISVSYFLFEKSGRAQKFLLLASLASFIALVLTFSRSSYLAFIASTFTIGITKSRKLLALIVLTLVLTFAAIPQVRTRIMGALTLDETAQARIESWQNALTVIGDNPLAGIGFNTYRFAQGKYNFFSADNPLGGHSGAGVDSSLLLVTATTGIIGISLFVFFLGATVKAISGSAASSPLHLATTASLLALLVHSIFVNSLFFPQIMLLIFPLLGFTAKYDS